METFASIVFMDYCLGAPLYRWAVETGGAVCDENGDFFSNELSVTLDSNSVAVAGSVRCLMYNRTRKLK